MTRYWSGLMRLFAERYSIPPPAFWRLSVSEAEALMTGFTPSTSRQVPDRAAFNQLLDRFPDMASNSVRQTNATV